MDTLYTGNIHGFTTPNGNSTEKSLGVQWGSQEGLVALGVVLGSSISLVGLAFAFITYSLFSDLRSLAGTALLSLLASLFMGQLLFVIGVGGVQDAELCWSLSLALLFMKLAALCWLCSCCHHTLRLFRSNANLIPRPEPKMGKLLAHYSLLSWGFPLLMVFVATAFKYREKEYNNFHRNNKQQISPHIFNEFNTNNNCWLMKGSSYIWGFLAPSILLLFISFYLAYQSKKVAQISVGLQVDARIKNKLAKRRNLQINLFIRILMLFTIVIIFGAIASIWNSTEFWAVYSIAQGIQGISTTLLVTCNCKILKLYTTPRSHRNRKGKYSGLEEGEGGRYGVLSITNPNYDNINDNNNNYNNEENVDDGGTSQPVNADSSFVKMNYNEDIIIKERHEHKDNTININCDLINSLPTNELSRQPLPQSV